MRAFELGLIIIVFLSPNLQCDDEKFGACIDENGYCLTRFESECKHWFRNDFDCEDVNKSGACIDRETGSCKDSRIASCEFEFVEGRICYYADPPGACVNMDAQCTEILNQSQCELDPDNGFTAYEDCS